MISVSTLTIILTILSILSTIAGLANAFGIFKLAGAKLRNAGDKLVEDAKKTPQIDDDRIAAVEREGLNHVAELLESGRAAEGLEKLKELAPHLVKK